MKSNKIKSTDEQKRMRSLRRKVIAASGMVAAATMFSACPTQIEYRDVPYWSEEEQPKPAFEEVFKTLNLEVRDRVRSAYKA